MKKIFLVVMAFAIGSIAMAAESDPTSSANGMAVIREGSTFKLFYKTPQATDVRVTIYNDADKVVFSETIKESNGFIRPYNFTKLDEGNYRIELKDERGTSIEKITYAAEIKTEQKIAKIVNLPGTEKYALLVPKNGSKSVSIQIYNQDGASVYSSTKRTNGDYMQLFDLKGLDSFSFVVSDSKGLSTTIKR